MADPEVAREAKDILQKKLFSVLGQGLLQRFQFDLPPIVGQVPADLPVLEVRAQQADLLFVLADGSLLDVELQSTYTEEDLLRFGDYSWAAFRKHQTRIRTLVLYGPVVTTEPPTAVDGGGHTFQLSHVLLAQQDGEVALERLVQQVARGERLAAADRVDLALIALLPHRRPLAEVVRAVLPVVRTLPVGEQAETIGTILGLGYHYLDAGVAAALLEAFKMANALEDLIAESIIQGHREGMAEGRREGRVEGKRAALRRLVERRFGALPATLDARISVADEVGLDALLDRAIVVDAVGEL